LYANAANIGEQNYWTLPDISIKACCREFSARNHICFTQDIEALSCYLADDANTESWAWEWLTPNNRLWQTEFETDMAYFIFK
jgi:hypothetical protein